MPQSKEGAYLYADSDWKADFMQVDVFYRDGTKGIQVIIPSISIPKDLGEFDTHIRIIVQMINSEINEVYSSHSEYIEIVESGKLNKPGKRNGQTLFVTCLKHKWYLVFLLRLLCDTAVIMYVNHTSKKCTGYEEIDSIGSYLKNKPGNDFLQLSEAAVYFLSILNSYSNKLKHPTKIRYNEVSLADSPSLIVRSKDSEGNDKIFTQRIREFVLGSNRFIDIVYSAISTR